jgi:hypothetical protein
VSMNKKEQAAFTQLQEEVRIAKAMRFTEPVGPDVSPPGYGGGGRDLAKGFLFNAYWPHPRVEPACSSSVHHNFGDDSVTRIQGARSLYSTRLLALKALRHELEQEAAKKLADIDAQIEVEAERAIYRAVSPNPASADQARAGT